MTRTDYRYTVHTVGYPAQTVATELTALTDEAVDYLGADSLLWGDGDDLRQLARALARAGWSVDHDSEWTATEELDRLADLAEQAASQPPLRVA